MSILQHLRRDRPGQVAGAAGRLASVDLTERNPIVVIPGIMGSRLIAAESSADLWAGDREGFARPDSDEQMRLFTMPMELGTPLHRLGGQVVSDGAVGSLDAQIAGISLRINAYGDLLSAMGVTSYTDTHSTRVAESGSAVAFEFSYDWRRSLDESARLLHEFLLRAARFVTVQRGLGWAPRFDIVAHSMGGLLLRYYLRYAAQPLALDGETMPCTWAGADLVERAFVVASPAGGSLMASLRLLTGLPGNPVHPGYDAAVPGSMPSLYQLLPRSTRRPLLDHHGKAVDPLDLDSWLSRGWGLASDAIDPTLARLLPGADTAAARREIALDHLEKCLRATRAFQLVMDRPVPPKPKHLAMHYILGGQKSTPIRAVVDDSKAAGGKKERVRVVEYGPGDATVPVSSALLDQRVDDAHGKIESPLQWDSVTLVPGNHLGLTREPAFVDNLVYRLLDDPGPTTP